MNMTSISGGAIAGAVVGSVVGLGICALLVFILLRKHISKKRRAAAARAKEEEEQTYRNRFVYADYAKPGSDFASPSLSSPGHHRHGSDPDNASETGGRSFSPEGFPSPTPDVDRQEPFELATMNRQSVIR